MLAARLGEHEGRVEAAVAEHGVRLGRVEEVARAGGRRRLAQPEEQVVVRGAAATTAAAAQRGR